MSKKIQTGSKKIVANVWTDEARQAALEARRAKSTGEKEQDSLLAERMKAKGGAKLSPSEVMQITAIAQARHVPEGAEYKVGEHTFSRKGDNIIRRTGAGVQTIPPHHPNYGKFASQYNLAHQGALVKSAKAKLAKATAEKRGSMVDVSYHQDKSNLSFVPDDSDLTPDEYRAYHTHIQASQAGR